MMIVRNKGLRNILKKEMKSLATTSFLSGIFNLRQQSFKLTFVNFLSMLNIIKNNCFLIFVYNVNNSVITSSKHHFPARPARNGFPMQGSVSSILIVESNLLFVWTSSARKLFSNVLVTWSLNIASFLQLPEELIIVSDSSSFDIFFSLL